MANHHKTLLTRFSCVIICIAFMIQINSTNAISSHIRIRGGTNNIDDISESDYIMLKSQLASQSENDKKETKIAILGDSTSLGTCPGDDEFIRPWVSHLQSMLKPIEEVKYTVRNFAVGSATICSNQILDSHPIQDSKEYKQILAWDPDVVFLMLGSNVGSSQTYHTKNMNTACGSTWQLHEDYINMANSLKNIKSQPDLFMMVPPPTNKILSGYDGQRIHYVYMPRQVDYINHQIPYLMQSFAKDLDLDENHYIDTQKALGYLSKYDPLVEDRVTCDGAHLNRQGAEILAQKVLDHLKQTKYVPDSYKNKYQSTKDQEKVYLKCLKDSKRWPGITEEDFSSCGGAF